MDVMRLVMVLVSLALTVVMAAALVGWVRLGLTPRRVGEDWKGEGSSDE